MAQRNPKGITQSMLVAAACLLLISFADGLQMSREDFFLGDSHCTEGWMGPKCDVDVDECTLNPRLCNFGGCQNKPGSYRCFCDPGYSGVHCNHKVVECQSHPCQNGSNCTNVQNSCACAPGLEGPTCQYDIARCDLDPCLYEDCDCSGTFYFHGKSHIRVPSNRENGYELHMEFRTMLDDDSDGLLAIGQGNDTHFTLQLKQGKLRLHSNLFRSGKEIFVGENLDNTKWQKVYVVMNTTHMTLGWMNGCLRVTQSIIPTDDTSFFNTYIGGIVKDQGILANSPQNFTGCIRDIAVNNIEVHPDVETSPNGSKRFERYRLPMIDGCPGEQSRLVYFCFIHFADKITKFLPWAFEGVLRYLSKWDKEILSKWEKRRRTGDNWLYDFNYPLSKYPASEIWTRCPKLLFLSHFIWDKEKITHFLRNGKPLVWEDLKDLE